MLRSQWSCYVSCHSFSSRLLQRNTHLVVCQPCAPWARNGVVLVSSCPHKRTEVSKLNAKTSGRQSQTDNFSCHLSRSWRTTKSLKWNIEEKEKWLFLIEATTIFKKKSLFFFYSIPKLSRSVTRNIVHTNVWQTCVLHFYKVEY